MKAAAGEAANEALALKRAAVLRAAGPRTVTGATMVCITVFMTAKGVRVCVGENAPRRKVDAPSATSPLACPRLLPRNCAVDSQTARALEPHWARADVGRYPQGRR